jgi:predicted DNA-binding ribbon-helix-helix protein
MGLEHGGFSIPSEKAWSCLVEISLIGHETKVNLEKEIWLTLRSWTYHRSVGIDLP